MYNLILDMNCSLHVWSYILKEKKIYKNQTKTKKQKKAPTETLDQNRKQG